MKTFWKKLLPWIILILVTQSVVLCVYGIECIITHYPNRGIGMLITIGIELVLSIIYVVVTMIIQSKKTKREKSAADMYDKLLMEAELIDAYTALSKNITNYSKEWLVFRCDTIIKSCKSYKDLFGYNAVIESIYEETQKILDSRIDLL